MPKIQTRVRAGLRSVLTLATAVSLTFAIGAAGAAEPVKLGLQKPRPTPSEDAYNFRSPLVNRTLSRGKPASVETGAPVCRRQLSQWQ